MAFLSIFFLTGCIGNQENLFLTFYAAIDFVWHKKNAIVAFYTSEKWTRLRHENLGPSVIPHQYET